jgi:sodium-coupled monocarboxylate transporter 8/12
MRGNFSVSNWIIVGLYLLAVCTIGSFFYRRKSSAAEYFLGGRSMRVIPVAISLVAADLSGMTVMGAPAWGFEHNMELFLGTVTYLLAAPIIMYVFMPFYSRFNFYTGYQYLELRFDVKVRLLGSFLFLLTRGAHVAIVIYVPSLVMSLLTGLPMTGCVLAIGALTTIYTTLGGMKAVIWTDVLQFSVLLTGIIGVFWASISRVPGGFGAAYHLALEAGRFHMFNFSTNPSEFTSVWAMVIGSGTLVVATLGTDQACLQRYFTTRSLSEGRKSVLLDAMIVIPVAGLLYVLGFALFAFYHSYPERLAGLPMTDQILPFFVVHELHGAVVGFVIAAIFAASMAVVSAGINSLSTVTTIDFYQRLLHNDKPNANSVFVGRLATVGWGLAATGGALFANHLGPIVNAFNLINSFLGGPILGIFLLGMLTYRAKANATIIGAAVGMLSVALISWKMNVSFFYYSFIGVVVTWGVGYLLSLPGAVRDRSELKSLVYRVGDLQNQ